MPARVRYTLAHVQMFDLAIQARRRGLSFEDFWKEARRPGRPVVTVKDENPEPNCVLFPTDTTDRHASAAALDATKEAWRRAYNGEPPTTGESAIRLLAPLLSGLRQGSDAGDSENGFEAESAVA